MIPFYVCNAHQPILSATRLAEQGLTLQFGDNPNIQHPKGFTARLEQRDSLYYLNARIMTLPDNLKLNIEQADDGTISAMIAPTTALTPEGPTVVLGGRQNYWTYNSEGFLVRIHKVPRKALFQPDQNEHVQRPSRNLRTIGERPSGETTTTMRTSPTTTLP